MYRNVMKGLPFFEERRLNLVISGGTLEYVYTLSDDGSTVELCSPGTDTVHKWTKA